MNVSIKSCLLFQTLIFCILLLNTANGYPTARTENSIESTEKQYPNGTVIGKYAYIDKEGNPIQIKYYADDSSYGVELKSYRVVHKEESANIHNENQSSFLDESIPNIPSTEAPQDSIPKDGAFDLVDTFKYPAEPSENKFNAAKPDYLERKVPSLVKNIHTKNKYQNPDFEVYAKDEDSQQCGANNEKVRVYNIVKEARKIREVPEKEAEGQYCRF